MYLVLILLGTNSHISIAERGVIPPLSSLRFLPQLSWTRVEWFSGLLSVEAVLVSSLPIICSGREVGYWSGIEWSLCCMDEGLSCSWSIIVISIAEILARLVHSLPSIPTLIIYDLLPPPGSWGCNNHFLPISLIGNLIYPLRETDITPLENTDWRSGSNKTILDNGNIIQLQSSKLFLWLLIFSSNYHKGRITPPNCICDGEWSRGERVWWVIVPGDTTNM